MENNTEKGNLKPSIIKVETFMRRTFFITNAEYTAHLFLACLLLSLNDPTYDPWSNRKISIKLKKYEIYKYL